MIRPEPEPRGAMFFSPNLTGPLHIGSAVVLWLTAREARERNLRFIVNFDMNCPSVDHPGKIRRRPALADRMATMESARAACELLNIPEVEFRFRQDYWARYWEVFEMLKKRGSLRAVGHTHWVSMDAHFAYDRIIGPIYDVSEQVSSCYTFSQAFCALVDWWDFETPLHIRGQDIRYQSAQEQRLWRIVSEVLGDRPGMEYAHIPEIFRADHTPLHKSHEGVLKTRAGMRDDPYLFTEWARYYDGPLARREALEQIVLKPGADYALSNIPSDHKSAIYYDAILGIREYNPGACAETRWRERTPGA